MALKVWPQSAVTCWMHSRTLTIEPIVQAPPTPDDEGERLIALCNLGLLDTAPEEAFDRVTRLTARAIDAPIVLVSLIDETRQWFKSRFGTDATQAPREISFCAHAVFKRKPLVVNDASLDARFAANPLVTGAPYVRAYLGIPICALNGQPVGTLCAIDTRTRHFGSDDVSLMSSFAEIVTDIIHAREQAILSVDALAIAAEHEQLYQDTFELGAAGIVHTTLGGQLLRTNPRVSELLGYSPEELHGCSFVDITHPDDVSRNMGPFLQLIAGKLDRYHLQKRFLHKDGRTI